MRFTTRNPILQSFIDEIANKMRERVGEPDIDEFGNMTFINKEWGEEDEKEFLNWVSERLNSDQMLWRTFSPFPQRKKYVERVVDSFTMYTPRVK